METAKPRLGILAFHPIQYQTPLFQRLAQRGVVELDVLFIDDTGLAPRTDAGFGIELSWDIDLVGGYRHEFLSRHDAQLGIIRRMRTLRTWIREQDVVVLHGYSHPLVLVSVALCQLYRQPYLLRGDSKPESQSTHRVRRWFRNRVASFVVSHSAGALTAGKLNSEFYSRFGQDRHYWAPYSVDNERFAAAPGGAKAKVLARHALPSDRPLVLFVGKFQRIKRPLDVLQAAKHATQPLSILFIGEGELRPQLEAGLTPGLGRVVGFVNQSELPCYYAAADILVLASEIEQWGLVVNEAMAAGVLPIVSSTVGAGPDLVEGTGVIYPTADVAALTAALDATLPGLPDDAIRDRVKEHASRFSLDITAEGYEVAAAEARRD